MAIRLDYSHIKSLAKSGDFLCILPDEGRHMLMTMCEPLSWDATFIDRTYEKDERDAKVALTLDGLAQGESVNAISTAIDDLATKLEACCAGLTSMLQTSVPFVPVTPNLGTTDPAIDPAPTGFATWGEYHCAAGYALADDIAAQLDKLHAIGGKAATLAGVGAVLVTMGLIFLTGGTALAIIGAGLVEAIAVFGAIQALSSLSISELADALRADNALKEQLGCAFQSATSAPSAVANVRAVFDTLPADQSLVSKTVAFPSVIESLWRSANGDGELDLSAWAGVSCNCAGNVLIDAQWPTDTMNFYLERTTYYPLYGGVIRMTPNGSLFAVIGVDTNTIVQNGSQTGVVQNAVIEWNMWLGGDDNSVPGEEVWLDVRRESDGTLQRLLTIDVSTLPGKSDDPDALTPQVFSVAVPFDMQWGTVGSNRVIELRANKTGGTRHYRVGYMKISGDLI